LGLAEIFSQTGNLVVVEWAEKLGELLPKDRIDIWLKTLDNGRHEVVVKKV
jgi:tRNA A37 threonylcarbamoyladenosine biosynthesis protein TsaE